MRKRRKQMKKLLLASCLLFLTVGVYAKNKGADITDVNKTQSISVSNTAWTALPSTTDTGRIQVILSIPNGTTDSFAIIISTDSANPGEPIDSDTYGMVLTTDNDPWILSINGYNYIYGLCTGASAATMNVQECKGEL